MSTVLQHIAALWSGSDSEDDRVNLDPRGEFLLAGSIVRVWYTRPYVTTPLKTRPQLPPKFWLAFQGAGCIYNTLNPESDQKKISKPPPRGRGSSSRSTDLTSYDLSYFMGLDMNNLGKTFSVSAVVPVIVCVSISTSIDVCI